MTYRLLAAVALGLGCTSAKPRPVPAAAEEVVSAPPAVSYAAALKALTDLGLPLRSADQAGGVIETEYVDIIQYRQDAGQYPMTERLVRLRVNVTAHEAAPASRLAVYAVYAPFRSGLSEGRRGERAIPKDHPGMDLVRRIVGQVRKSAEGGP
jgi:hypothetical protein